MRTEAHYHHQPWRSLRQNSGEHRSSAPSFAIDLVLCLAACSQLPHTATARTMGKTLSSVVVTFPSHLGGVPDTLTVHTASSKQTTLLVFHTTTTSLTSTTAHIQPSTLTMTTWSLLATHTQPTLATHQDQECSPTKAATDPLMAELR